MAAKKKGTGLAYCVGLVNGEPLGYEIDIKSGKITAYSKIDTEGFRRIVAVFNEWLVSDAVEKLVKNGNL